MDKPGFIVPPPWLVPERDDESTVPAEDVAPASFPAFLPAPIGGMPAPALPPHSVPAPEEPSVAGWRLTLDDGQSIVVTGALVLGRDPAEVASRPLAGLVRVHDPARSVSKTHAVIDPGGQTLSVTDLGSTNGVSITAPDGRVTDLDPGGQGFLESGSRLILGEFGVAVSRE